MPNYEFTRTIVNKGVILLTPEQREVSGFSLWCQIEREDGNASKNFKYPRPESWYGVVQRLSRGYVTHTYPLKYENQLVMEFRNEFHDSLLVDLCLWKKTMEVLTLGLGPAIAAVGDLIEAATDIPIPELPITPEALLNRFETDAFVVKLFGKTTAVFRVYGQEPPNVCELDIEWFEPAGPAIPDPDTPTRPSPAPNVPVNPKDPNGYDLPDRPYNRADDDDGDSYDPPRPDDLPEASGTGPWQAVLDMLPRDTFPPFNVNGPAYQAVIDIGGGSVNVSNPRVTAYIPGPGGWNAVADGAYTNAVTGATNTFQLNGRSQPYDELTNVTFRKV